MAHPVLDWLCAAGGSELGAYAPALVRCGLHDEPTLALATRRRLRSAGVSPEHVPQLLRALEDLREELLDRGEDDDGQDVSGDLDALLRHSRAEQEKELAALKAEHSHLAGLAAEVPQLQSRNNVLERRSQQFVASLGSLETTCSALTERNSALQEQLAQQGSLLAALRAAADEAGAERDEARAERDAARADAEAAAAAARKADNLLGAARRRGERLEGQVEALKDRVRELRGRRSSPRASPVSPDPQPELRRELERALAEAAAASEAAAGLERERDELLAELRRARLVSAPATPVAPVRRQSVGSLFDELQQVSPIGSSEGKSPILGVSPPLPILGRASGGGSPELDEVGGAVGGAVGGVEEADDQDADDQDADDQDPDDQDADDQGPDDQAPDIQDADDQQPDDQDPDDQDPDRPTPDDQDQDQDQDPDPPQAAQAQAHVRCHSCHALLSADGDAVDEHRCRSRRASLALLEAELAEESRRREDEAAVLHAGQVRCVVCREWVPLEVADAHSARCVHGGALRVAFEYAALEDSVWAGAATLRAPRAASDAHGILTVSIPAYAHNAAGKTEYEVRLVWGPHAVVERRRFSAFVRLAEELGEEPPSKSTAWFATPDEVAAERRGPLLALLARCLERHANRIELQAFTGLGRLGALLGS